MVVDTRNPLTGPPTSIGSNELAELIWVRAFRLGNLPYLVPVRGNRPRTFRDLDDAVVFWSTQLDAHHVAPGDLVGLCISDPIEFAMVFLSVIASGRWAAPLDPHVLGEGGSVATSATRLGLAMVIADRSAPRGGDMDWLDLHGMVKIESRFADTVREPTPRPSRAGGVLLASSGTTGSPKVMALSVDQLIHAARLIAEHHQLSPSDRGFNPLPMFHINAEVVGLLATLVAGASVVLDDRFHRTRFWCLMDRLAVTWINAVPAIISHLADPGPQEVVPSGIRFIRSASAPLSTATLARFEARVGIPVLETYGMTEAASQIAANPLIGMRKPGSVGLPVGVELRVVADDGLVVPGGKLSRPPRVGTVEIRGPSVITAYAQEGYQDRFDQEGWLQTGDLGYLDEDGYLFLAGRSDDVINRGGEKVFPREIEELILLDPDVAEVVVVGQSHPIFGQVPVGFLVLRDGAAVSPGQTAPAVVERIRLALDSALARTKQPTELHVVPALPKGRTGKVQRQSVGANLLHGTSCLRCR